MVQVLVVEDQEDSRRALQLILEGYKNVQVKTTGSKEEARAEIAGSKVAFDLFLLDINLDVEKQEDVGGYELAEEIRGMERYELTPIVMVTSVANMEMSAYRKLHCYSFLVKPYLKEEIQELIEKILAHKKEEQTPSIVVKKEGINYKVKCQEIVYIKAIPRGVLLTLRREEMKVPYLSIRQLLEKSPEKEFLQIHRMCVINTRYLENVDMVNRIVKMRGQPEQLEIGVTYKEK